jgi:hypothetical protein
MAVFHLATNTPTKAEILTGWIPTQAWGHGVDEEAGIVGSFHLDDPDGEVGIETHLVSVGEVLLQVPLTYRGSPLDDVEPIATMEHSALGTRWVYDAVRDDRFVMVLCGMALAGQGESLGWAHHEGRWYVAPTTIKLSHRGPRVTDPVAVDGLRLESEDLDHLTYRRGKLSLTFHRRLRPAVDGEVGLTAAWDTGPGPVLLATAVRHAH